MTCAVEISHFGEDHLGLIQPLSIKTICVCIYRYFYIYMQLSHHGTSSTYNACLL